MANGNSMVGRMMDGLVGRARVLESRLTDTVERASQRLTQSVQREPLEIAHAVVDAVERHAHVTGRGKRALAANDVRVTVAAATREAREQLTAVFEGAMPLRERIAERLEGLGCPVEHLDVAVSFSTQPRPGWLAPDFHVTFHRTERRPQPEEPLAPAVAIHLHVRNGAAEQATYTLSQGRVDIGRCRDVRDARQRLIRANHVVFVDADDPVNQSVSRQHAHIAVEGAGEVRLYDDGSVHGTSIVRSGHTIPVPPGSRGVRLRSGDAILLGDARMDVTLAPI
jgi:hypothetical protein